MVKAPEKRNSRREGCPFHYGTILGLSFGDRESGSSPSLAPTLLLENRPLNEEASQPVELQNDLSFLPPVLFLRFSKVRSSIFFFGSL